MDFVKKIGAVFSPPPPLTVDQQWEHVTEALFQCLGDTRLGQIQGSYDDLKTKIENLVKTCLPAEVCDRLVNLFSGRSSDTSYLGFNNAMSECHTVCEAYKSIQKFRELFLHFLGPHLPNLRPEQRNQLFSFLAKGHKEKSILFGSSYNNITEHLELVIHFIEPLDHFTNAEKEMLLEMVHLGNSPDEGTWLFWAVKLIDSGPPRLLHNVSKLLQRIMEKCPNHLSDLDKDRLFTLLLARHDNSSAILHLLVSGYPPALSAYKNFLLSVLAEFGHPLSVPRRCELARTVFPNPGLNTPVLHRLLLDPDSTTTRLAFVEYRELITGLQQQVFQEFSRLEIEQLANFLLAKNSAGIPTIYLAFKEKNLFRIEAYKTHLLPLLPIDDRIALMKSLIAIDKKNDPEWPEFCTLIEGWLFEEAEQLRANEKFHGAFNLYQELAERLHGEASFQLACMYRDGTHVKQDWYKAFYAFRFAALRGHLQAEEMVGSYRFEDWVTSVVGKKS